VDDAVVVPPDAALTHSPVTLIPQTLTHHIELLERTSFAQHLRDRLQHVPRLHVDLGGRNVRMVTVALRMFIGEDQIEWGLLMARWLRFPRGSCSCSPSGVWRVA